MALEDIHIRRIFFRDELLKGWTHWYRNQDSPPKVGSIITNNKRRFEVVYVQHAIRSGIDHLVYLKLL